MAPDITPEHARDPDGRWRPGVSPNPGGRPAVLREVRELARQHTARAIQRLSDMLDDEDGRVVVAAASVLLDRAWGKPEQAVVADVTVASAVDVDALRASLLVRVAALAGAQALPPETVVATPAPSAVPPRAPELPENTAGPLPRPETPPAAALLRGCGMRDARTTRVPGELPADPSALPRDVGPCDVCGNVELLAPGSSLCPPCEAFSRAAAQVRAAQGGGARRAVAPARGGGRLNPNLRASLAQLTPAQVRDLLARLSAEELLALRYDWATWARPEQVPPDDGEWSTFLYLAGRGAGKTRSAAEWVRRMAREHAGCRVAIVARTAADVRDVCIEGESGLLAVHPPSEAPLYEPSKRRITWRNGSQATAYSADEPDLLRGPQHHYAWCDELATWERLEEAWANLRLGLRLGQHPRCVVTTTPRPLPLLRELLQAPTTIVRRGSTYDNAANLAPSALAEFRARYEGTRLGRQELHAELLDDVPGALWNRALLDDNRVKPEVVPELVRVVVGVDPAVTSGEASDSTGIVVVGRARSGHLYVLADRTCKLSPDGWARRVVAAYDEFRADRVVAETNNGGDLVEATLRTVRRDIPFRKVTASRGKRVRAEPIAALYEQGKVHHVGGFSELEDQMCTFAPDNFVGSPDRVDALVWAATVLAHRGGSGLAALAALAGAPQSPRPPAEEAPRATPPEEPGTVSWPQTVHLDPPSTRPGPRTVYK